MLLGGFFVRCFVLIVTAAAMVVVVVVMVYNAVVPSLSSLSLSLSCSLAV